MKEIKVSPNEIRKKEWSRGTIIHSANSIACNQNYDDSEKLDAVHEARSWSQINQL